jgi:hypothetical protein
MELLVNSETPVTVPSKGVRFAGPIWTLILLAPFIAEVLSGSTRLSVLFVYIPEVMVWGVGALLCRELARRWHAGAATLLLLGLGLSIAEEFIIQQTSVAPLPFPGSHADYGRVWGVNLVYLLFMLGFESVWVVVVPVQVTELFFPQRSRQPWLRTRGLIVACVLFLLGCRIAWYGWTQQALPRMHVAPYRPPTLAFVIGFASIGLLIWLAYLLRGFGVPSQGESRRTAPAWLAGGAAFVMGVAWFNLIGQIFVPKPIQPFWIALALGIGWAIVAFALFVAWSSRRSWSGIHRWSTSFGAALACMTTPYMTASSWPKADLVAVMIFDVIALTGFVLLGRKVFSDQNARKLEIVIS